MAASGRIALVSRPSKAIDGRFVRPANAIQATISTAKGPDRLQSDLTTCRPPCRPVSSPVRPDKTTVRPAGPVGLSVGL